MENGENIKHQKRRDSKTTLFSVLGVEDAKKKLKNIAERRRGTISEENQEASSNKGGETSMLENLKATLADLKAVEAERQHSVPGLQQLEQKKEISLENQCVQNDEGSLKAARRQDRMPTGLSGTLEDHCSCCAH